MISWCISATVHALTYKGDALLHLTLLRVQSALKMHQFCTRALMPIFIDKSTIAAFLHFCTILRLAR